MVPAGSNSSTGAKPTVAVAVAVAVVVAADTGISGFGRLRFYCFQQAKRERAQWHFTACIPQCFSQNCASFFLPQKKKK